MSKSRAQIINEIRYAERLCQRTARLYRHIQAVGTCLAVVGGSATLSAIASATPHWIAVSGAAIFAASGAAMIAIRPADKAAMNEADAKRYSALRAKAMSLDDNALELALEEARTSDVAEVETLRNPSYNDVVTEAGQPSHCVRLTVREWLVSAVA